MIAVWMAYAIVISALLLAATAALERVFRSLRLPLRTLWAAALAIAVLACAATLLAFVSKPPLTNGGVTRYADGAPVGPPPAEGPPATSGMPVDQRARTQFTGGEGASAAPRTLRLWGHVPVNAGGFPRWLDALLLLGWAGGSLGVLALILASMRRVRGSHPEWRLQHVDGVPVFVSHDTGPALFGILEHRIVIPQWVLELNATARRLVLQHEWEHARVADPVLLLCAAAGPVLMPWNPVMWYMLRRLRLAVELDCDRRVLSSHPDPRAYGEVLLEVTERSVPQSLQFAALSQPAAILAARIDAIASRRHFPLGWSAFHVTAAVAALVLVLAAPRPRLVVTHTDRLAQVTAELGALVSGATAGNEMSLIDRMRLLRRFERQLAPEAALLVPPTRPELREIVRELYPSLLSGTSQPVVVGVLLDRELRVLQHASQALADERLEAPGNLYLLFPDLAPEAVGWSGVAANVGERSGSGRVSLVYGIVK